MRTSFFELTVFNKDAHLALPLFFWPNPTQWFEIRFKYKALIAKSYRSVLWVREDRQVSSNAVIRFLMRPHRKPWRFMALIQDSEKNSLSDFL